ncbi:ABC-F family ATP-binding cassette domain-containing protein [Lacibacter luteus]|uniref:ABC-F family ATP-binding cassette domain-containing protein n=1 Tax=Lacibacter luteus TaxID=2508719 RepID=A0A4Q1CJL0_9BACT|nr:ABC-F family ATP-binding cassette domain-containing protein [Lacibacter luteus]RXK60557.1 ABC-F family ATP-binding cassette domain-containing protein [Lacibacter luteus]
MLILKNLSYTHPDKEVLFQNLQLSISAGDKIALIGANGSGKSTLLKLIAGDLPVTDGLIQLIEKPYSIPQIFGQYNHLRVAEALQVDVKLNALHAILKGDVSEQQLQLLNDDWTIEERCAEALRYWQLQELDLNLPMSSLSGGQKTKVFLAGIHIHQPSFILLDEPSNHLDTAGREVLYHYIRSSKATILLVSHDRTLLNCIHTVAELSRKGISLYGGNYDFYLEQKTLETEALLDDVKSKEKALRKAKEKEQESIERQQKLNARGKGKQEKAGIPTIAMNTLRNNAEKSTSKLKAVHDGKIGNIKDELQNLRNELPDFSQMRFGFDDSGLHNGKRLFAATTINHTYEKQFLWANDLDVFINSGERIALRGSNGSGKTSLLKIILEKLEPTRGSVYRSIFNAVYIDQDYSLISNQLTVYQQLQQYNTSALQEHELKSRLNRFLFTKDDWEKRCSSLSGGERMRLMLCCLTVRYQSPDLIVLDEPTNNLDLQSISILTMALNQYKGTLLVVSHDEYFLKEIAIERTITLQGCKTKSPL